MSGVGTFLKEGNSLYAQSQFEEAVAAFRRGLEAHPDSQELLLALGMAQMNGGKLEDALATFEQVTAKAPDDPMGFTSKSMCLQRMDKIEEAEKAQAQARMLSWKQELKTNPNAPPPDDGPMPVHQ